MDVSAVTEVFLCQPSARDDDDDDDGGRHHHVLHRQGAKEESSTERGNKNQCAHR